LAEYERVRPEFEARGARIAALSVDAANRSEAVRRQSHLAFPVLCDPSRETLKAWGLYNAEEKGGIAKSATFVLASDRRVEFVTVDSVAKRVLAPDLLRWFDSHDPPARQTIRPGLGAWATVTMNVALRGLKQR
jgi:peroxiredoxin